MSAPDPTTTPPPKRVTNYDRAKQALTERGVLNELSPDARAMTLAMLAIVDELYLLARILEGPGRGFGQSFAESREGWERT